MQMTDDKLASVCESLRLYRKSSPAPKEHDDARSRRLLDTLRSEVLSLREQLHVKDAKLSRLTDNIETLSQHDRLTNQRLCIDF